MNIDVEKLLEGFARQRELYEKMVEVTREQNRRIESNEVDALLKVLENKNQLLREIGDIETGAAPLRRQWNEAYKEMDAETVKRVETGIGGTKEVLQALLKLEEEGREMMERQRGTAGDQIRQIQQKRKVRNAYGQKRPGGSQFIDDQS